MAAQFVFHAVVRHNHRVTAAAEFIDAALQYEASWDRSHPDTHRLRYYGTSVGAIRGTVRDAARRYPGMPHDEVMALASELWERPVFERRLAAIVLLQSRASELIVTDLTRLEGFLRHAEVAQLADPLVSQVIRPLVENLDERDLARATTVFERWVAEDSPWLRAAAEQLRDDR